MLDFLRNFDFNGVEITSISELVWERLLQLEDYRKIFSIHENIKVDTRVGFVGEGGLVGVADQGCDPTAQSYNPAGRQLKWEPVAWEVYVQQCYEDLEATVGAYALANGTRKTDLTKADIANFCTDLLMRSLAQFLHRFAWFGDKDVENATDDGTLTDGVNKAYFNLVDGFWKQIMAQCTTNAGQLVKGGINTANAKTTKATQVLDNATVLADLEAMVDNAPARLLQSPDKAFLVTHSVYAAYKRALTTMELQGSWQMLQDGKQVLTFDGIPVIDMPWWDEHIKSYFDNGTVYDHPHRALLCPVGQTGILGLGCDSISNFSKLDIWYDKNSRNTRFLAMGSSDAKLLDPTLFMAAY